MKVGFSDTYTDPQIVLAELLTELDAPSAIRFLEDTVVNEAGACGRRESAKRLWRNVRATTPVTDAELQGFAVKVAEHFQAKAERAEGFLR